MTNSPTRFEPDVGFVTGAPEMYVNTAGSYIKFEDYEQLKQRLDAVVAENVALKAGFEKPDAWLSWHGIPPTWTDPGGGGEYLQVHEQPGDKNDDGSDSWAVYRKPEIETPATSAALAEVEAKAIEKFADHLSISESPFASIGSVRNFAKQIREAK